MNELDKVKRYKTNTGDDARQMLLTKYITAEIARKDNEALKELLNSESGRWFLMRLLDATKVNAVCFTGNSKTFYNEGRRDVGLGIIADIVKLAVGLKAEDAVDWEAGMGFSSKPEDGHLKADKAEIEVVNKKNRTPGKLTDTDVVKNSFVIGDDAVKNPNADNNAVTDVRK